MKRIFLTTLISLSLQKFLHAQAHAVASQTLQIVLSDIIDIRFVENKLNIGPELHLAFDAAEDYLNGIETPRQMLRVSTNRNFTVTVHALAQNKNHISSDFLPRIYLKIQENNTGGTIANMFNHYNYALLSPGNQPLLQAAQKGDNQTFSVQYLAKPGMLVPPGIYAVDVIFTESRY